MAFNFHLPGLSSFSWKVQCSILVVFLVASYFNSRARAAVQLLTIALLIWEFGLRLVGLVWLLFKGVAWLGFYIYFFKQGVDYLLFGLDWLMGGGIDGFLQDLDRKNREGAQQDN
ncbi:hypothetical protein D9619_010203 [Psilocybe cf. subviscida]|uniref:Uncharacterized protein n=1 Tax=Psilocybe cf. subviscida TaxID=2480587 RepID=A0A8H5AS19_9AGAR|nr:hypothetical protein D9619_010203 [Psilocybe cf. subviscida]